MENRILILDYGSESTQLIARTIREERVYSEIHAPTVSIDWIRKWGPKGIILSGGSSSVRGGDALTADPELLQLGVPVLGIGYGMRLIAELEGGRIRPGRREPEDVELEIQEPDPLFDGFEPGETMNVWTDFDNRIESVPPRYKTLASAPALPIAAFRAADRPIYGVQFCPAESETPRGDEVIANFVFRVCGSEPSWTPGAFIESAVERIREQVGDANVICGLSGGVDSSVAAALVHQAVGDQLTCIFVDNGLLRKGEREGVERAFERHLGVRLIVVDAADEFLGVLDGIDDPEEKRRRIGETFIRVFESSAAGAGWTSQFLVQGTLYSDVVESLSVLDPSVQIKSHHNVGGLPEDMPFELVEPLRELFKDEVRQVGRELALPEELVARHPFPGPGLAIRVLGEVTQERLEILRDADAIYLDEIRAAGLYDDIWQAFAVLLPIRTVGVTDAKRTYEHVVSLRAVTSQDGTRAEWFPFPHDVLAKISTRIIDEVDGVNRVCYDISSKPPATIEWE